MMQALRFARRTKAANAYVADKRQRTSEFTQATWFDVADAYDSGMRHAILNRRSARLQFDELESETEGQAK
jgi:hypothetical protein